LTLFVLMKQLPVLFCLSILTQLSCFSANSQDVESPLLLWEKKVINLGSVLEENGPVKAVFLFTNKTNQRLLIEEIITECGCTTAEYSRDTLSHNEKGKVVVNFDPQTRGGEFVKMILVKTNVEPFTDTLIVEGFNVPLPASASAHYAIEKAGLGFKLGVVNLGQVFTNQPKLKHVDFFNFGDFPIQLNQIQENLPAHVTAKLIPAVVTAKTRGVLELTYDAQIKDDLGFFDEEITLALLSDEKKDLSLQVIATIHEYFEPVPLAEKDNVPRLEIKDMEIDLSRIKSNQLISRQVTMENKGGQLLKIRKIISNCDCVSFIVPKEELQPGERMDITMTFDPRGRKGIDHRTMTVYSNDPLWPTRTVRIKSRIN
jgi:hypothetical protein